MTTNQSVYQAQVVYWHGEDLSCSEPRYTYSEDKQTREEAEEWGRATATSPSPWPGRDYDDHFEVVEYELVWEDGVQQYEEQVRWIWFGGKLDEEVRA